MKLSVTNTEKNKAHLQLKPFLVPYCNEAMLAPWDKNEWYLRSGFGNEADKGVFWTELLNPSGDKSKRRTMVMFTDGEGLKNTELSLEKFVGNGSVYCPEFAVNGELRIPADRTNGYGNFEKAVKIDYIYYHTKDKYSYTAELWDDEIDGIYLSDHYPVCVNVKF